MAMDAPDSPTEVTLRTRLYELDSAIDAARQEKDSVPKLASLAAQRQEVHDQLDILLPPGDMGYQHNEDRRRDKMDIDQVPIPVVGDSGGAGF